MNVKRWMFAIGCSILAPACGSPVADAEAGRETGPCLDNACLNGLTCLSELCVDPSPGGDGSNAEDDDDGGQGDDAGEGQDDAGEGQGDNADEGQGDDADEGADTGGASDGPVSDDGPVGEEGSTDDGPVNEEGSACNASDECQIDADCVGGSCVGCICVSDEGPAACEAPTCDGCSTCDDCFVCVQSPGGDCADEVEACNSSQPCLDILNCTNECADQACAQDCYDAFPSGQAAYYNLIGCVFAGDGSGACDSLCG